MREHRDRPGGAVPAVRPGADRRADVAHRGSRGETAARRGGRAGPGPRRAGHLDRRQPARRPAAVRAGSVDRSAVPAPGGQRLPVRARGRRGTPDRVGAVAPPGTGSGGRHRSRARGGRTSRRARPPRAGRRRRAPAGLRGRCRRHPGHEDRRLPADGFRAPRGGEQCGARGPSPRVNVRALRPARLLTAVLVAGSVALYVVGVDRSGWGNSFYAAAAQAGAQSWKAFFFGASDAAGTITVDKPPASIWVMSLSVRLFGLSSWSLLVPEALMGAAAVALLAATVRRVAGEWAGLLAGLLLALTPVMTLMARVDDPDALLTLLLVAAAWSTTRAMADGRLRWALLTGALLGFAFLTKSLAALLVLPGLVAAFLLAAPGPLGRRIGHLLAAGGALLVAAGWWLLAVELTPASSRPWVGGSPANSPLDLAFGYNGLGRITGNESGAGVHVVGAGSPWRLLGSGADQFGWLLPFAVVGLIAGLVLRRGQPRGDLLRAALLLWAGWAVPAALVFSFMQGTWHSYYTVELAPAVAALTALGVTLLWRRHTPAAFAVLATGSLATTAWSVSLVDRVMPPDGPVPAVVLLFGLVGVVVLAAGGMVDRSIARMGVVFLLVAALAGPASWSMATAQAPHTGSSVRAGPASSAPGSGVGNASVPPELLRALRQDTDDWTWTAASVGRYAAELQLAARAPVMPIGGYYGRDPAPTLGQFQAEVRAHRIHWYVPGLVGSGVAVRIDRWVRTHAPEVRVGPKAIYDLAGLAAGS